MENLLTGNTATLVISNSSSIRIRLKDEDTVEYQFIGPDSAGPVLESTIEYRQDENLEDKEYYPCFYTLYGGLYFIHDFLRDDYGK